MRKKKVKVVNLQCIIMQPLQPKVNTILNLVLVGLGKVVRNVSSTFSLWSTWPLYSVYIPVSPSSLFLLLATICFLFILVHPSPFFFYQHLF